VRTQIEFVELHDWIVSRLTYFNISKGGEPARLTLKEREDANSGAWLNAKEIHSYEETDKQMFSEFRLTCQTGKGNNHLVPILFPLDTIS
jgi:hypothetical protein